MATITRTIGSAAGRDYSTVSSWEADLDDSGIYSSGDDAVGDVFNDSVFNERVIINGGGTVGLNSIRLTGAAANEHDGTAGTGARFVTQTTGDIVDVQRGAVTIERLESDKNTFRGACFLTNTSTVIRQCIAHGPLTINLGVGIQLNGTGEDIINNFVYDVNSSKNTQTGGGIVDVNGTGSNQQILNNTVFDIGGSNSQGIKIQDVGTNEVRNCISLTIATESSFSPSSPSSATMNRNMSSDTSASGAGSLTNQTASNEFVSTTAGSEDLHLKSGANAIDAGVDLGTTPTNIEFDISNRDRDDLADTWDMGAHELTTDLEINVSVIITVADVPPSGVGGLIPVPGQGFVFFGIGTNARAFSTISLWEANLDDSFNYLPNNEAIGECFNDSTFDEKFTINGGSTIPLLKRTLTVASGEEHDGTAGTGVRLVRSGSGEIATVDINSTEIHLIEFDANFRNVNNIYTSLSIESTVIRQTICHGMSENGVVNAISLTIPLFTTCSVLNNVIYDIESTGGSPQADCKGIKLLPGGNTRCYNNTVHNIRQTRSANAFCIGFNDVDVVEIRNCIATDPGGATTGRKECFEIAILLKADTRNNLSTDTTASGPGSFTNKASVNQFISIVIGSEDLHLKDSADAIDAGIDLGVTPSGVELDIDGSNRDTLGVTWDMGADESLPPAPSVSDTVTITESVTSELTHNVNVNDTVTVSENVNTSLIHTVNVNESITITENISVVSSVTLEINVNDSVTVSESITVENTNLGGVDVSDSVTITEFINAKFPSDIDVSDTVTIDDDTVFFPGEIFENITLSEDVTVEFDDVTISVSETITVAEDITMFIPSIELSDSITVTESVTVERIFLVNVSDTVTLTESITVENLNLGGIDVNESIDIVENIGIEFEIAAEPAPNVSDTVTLTESITTENLNLGGINVSDSITLTDDVVVGASGLISVVDTVTISEDITVENLNLGGIDVNDRIGSVDTTTVTAITPISFVPRINLLGVG